MELAGEMRHVPMNPDDRFSKRKARGEVGKAGHASDF
jgi:hypothetical protein